MISCRDFIPLPLPVPVPVIVSLCVCSVVPLLVLFIAFLGRITEQDCLLHDIQALCVFEINQRDKQVILQATRIFVHTPRLALNLDFSLLVISSGSNPYFSCIDNSSGLFSFLYFTVVDFQPLFRFSMRLNHIAHGGLVVV